MDDPLVDASSLRVSGPFEVMSVGRYSVEDWKGYVVSEPGIGEAAKLENYIEVNRSARQSPKKEVLLIYKYQPYVEKRHALFKSELEVAPVYIKKPQRAAGLVHATFLAMIVDALIERALRQGMKRSGIETLPILPEGRLTKTPTTARLLEMFSGLSWYEFERAGETVTFPIQLTPLQRQLLRLLGMDASAYD